MARQSSNSRTHILFVFPHREMAERAVQMLVADGVKERRITLFAQAGAGPGVSTDKLEQAIDTGGAAGASLGALAGAAVCAIPGIGPVLGVGSLAAAVTGAILGGSAGGVSGSVVGLGVAEAAAALTRHHLRQGQAILLIATDSDGPRISSIAHGAGAIEEAII